MKPDFDFKQLCFLLVPKVSINAYVSLPWIDGFNIISPPLLSTVYLISKARAAQEGASIFLPLFLVFPYQSEKVEATPTRETEIEGKAAGSVLKQKNKKIK